MKKNILFLLPVMAIFIILAGLLEVPATATVGFIAFLAVSSLVIELTTSDKLFNSVKECE